MSLALESKGGWISLSSRPAGCAQQVSGHLGLCRETMSQTNQNKILNYNHRITHKEHEGTQVWRRKLSLISLAILLNLNSTGSRELELDIIKNCQILNKRCLKTSTYYLNRIENTWKGLLHGSFHQNKQWTEDWETLRLRVS